MSRLWGLVCGVVGLTACARTEPSPPAAPSAPPIAASSTNTAAHVLDQLDPRKAVPLLPRMAAHQKQNMREHLVAVQELIAALARDDFAGVEQAAGRIGFSEQMGQMCTHMGSLAPGFTEQAVGFHHSADRISLAARERDRGRVLSELSATLQTCTSCHATWKQQVIDETTWQQLAASAPPSHP